MHLDSRWVGLILMLICMLLVVMVWWIPLKMQQDSQSLPADEAKDRDAG